LVNLENNPIQTSDGNALSLDSIAQRIRDAGAAQKYPWVASGTEPGKLQLATVVRGKHTVAVDVTFEVKAYSIRYASSINMNYKTQDGRELIHPFYNQWVQQLKQGIDMALKRP